MSSNLGIGVVGTGWVAGAHTDTWKEIEGAEVVHVVSRDRQRAEAFCRDRGLQATAGDDYAALLADDRVDVVAVCTPHPMHPDETVMAAEAKKHIVIEKPVALEASELRRMLEAVESAGVKTSVCFELRWIGLFQNVRSLVREGALGELFYGEASYFHGCGPWYPQYPWNRTKEMGRDAFLTAGCHALDGLIFLMEQPVVEVQAMANTSKANPLDYEYEPNVTANLRFANGAMGKVAVSVECRQPYLFPLLLQGTEGSIWNDKVSRTAWPGLGRERWATIPAALPDSGDVADHPYKSQFESFKACIEQDKRPHNDLSSCGHVHDVMFAIQEAVRTKKTVEVATTPGVVPRWDDA